MQAKASLSGKGSGLVEHIQVADSKLLLDGLCYLDCGLLIAIHGIVGANLD